VIDASVPVVVIFRGGYADVAIARTLGRLGVPMYLVAQEGVPTPAWSSRYWVERTRWDFSRPEDESVEFLLDLGTTIRQRRGARAILLTLADWVAIFIERNGVRLRDQFLFPQPVQPILHTLLNKWGMHLLAREHHIPTPLTSCPESLDDAEKFLDTAGIPVLMKAADPFVANRPPTRMVHSRQELMDELRQREATQSPLNVVLQEYIPGDVDSVWMCNGYFGPDPSRAVTFTGKKLRQESATGVATLAVCLPNETVADQTQRFMNGVGYRGCVGIGYRVDRRDGLYKVLDVNARVSGVFRLFAGTHKMDVVRVCYLQLTGQDVPAIGLQPGRKWMLEDDLVGSVAAIKSGRLGVAEWMRSLRGVRELHWLAADDPVPSLVWVRDRLRGRTYV
jgi:predicted ATP-grasp superfamily ATP-dependent carboligase